MIEALNITNVYQVKKYVGRMDIHFTINDFNYSLTMKEAEGRYEAWLVSHESKHVCPVCSEEANLHTTMSCRLLHKFKHRHALFQRLIEFPSIRLEWLYINHV